MCSRSFHMSIIFLRFPFSQTQLHRSSLWFRFSFSFCDFEPWLVSLFQSSLVRYLKLFSSKIFAIARATPKQTQTSITLFDWFKTILFIADTSHDYQRKAVAIVSSTDKNLVKCHCNSCLKNNQTFPLTHRRYLCRCLKYFRDIRAAYKREESEN